MLWFIEFINLSKQQTYQEFLARFATTMHIFYQHHKHPSLLFLFQDRKIGFDTLLLRVFFWDLKLDAGSIFWSQMFNIEYSPGPVTRVERGQILPKSVKRLSIIVFLLAKFQWISLGPSWSVLVSLTVSHREGKSDLDQQEM